MPEGLPSPLISIIIPHHGGEQILRECLDSIFNSTYSNIEVLVLDNDSPDDSINIIQADFSDIIIIKSDHNRGFAGGCNFLSEYAKGDYLLILNNDTIHEKDWMIHLLKRIESNHNISSVQPKIKNYDKKNYFDHAGGSGGFMDEYCFPFARGRIFDTIEKDEGQYDDACKIFWASGTAFLTKKNLFKKLGGFDETLFAHMEEIDYHWKCQMLGHEVWVEPNAVIYHHGGKTLPKTSPNKTYLNYRNSLILLLTNNPPFYTIKLFLPRFFMELISLIREIACFRWTHSFAIIRSWFWIILHPSHIMNRRNKLTKIIKIDTILRKSIVFQYFINGKKTYSKL